MLEITHITLDELLLCAAYSSSYLSKITFEGKKNHSLQFTYIHKHIHNAAYDSAFIPRYYLQGKVFFPLKINYKPSETYKDTVAHGINF